MYNTDGTNHFLGTSDRTISTIQDVKNDIGIFLENAFGENAFGEKNYVIDETGENNLIQWRPKIAEEVFTSEIKDPNRGLFSIPFFTHPERYARFTQSYRFVSRNSNAYFARIATHSTNDSKDEYKIGTATTDTNNDYRPTFEVVNSTTVQCYLTADDRSLGVFIFDPETEYSQFVWCGVLKSSSAAAEPFPLNCTAIASSTVDNGTSVEDAVRVGIADSATKQQILTSNLANYQITCANGRSSGVEYWSTDLYLIDAPPPVSSYSGRCSNLIIGKQGTDFEIGSMHIINEHRDGGSLKFICVGSWGEDKILMRMSDYEPEEEEELN